MLGQGSDDSLMSRLAFSEQSGRSSHLERKLSCQLPSKMTDLRDKKMHLDLRLDTLERKNKMKRISKTEEPLRTVQNHKARNK